MVLGISSFAYGWSVGVPGSYPSSLLSASELVDRTIHFGFNCLQLGDNLPVGEFTDAQHRDLIKHIRKNNLRLEIGARKLTRDHLDRYIQLAAKYQSPLLRFVVDGDGYEPNSETIIRIVRDALPLLRAHNITLGIENHDRFKALELAAIMETIDDPAVGICLDCVNSLGAGEGIEYVSQILAPHTVNLHIKDFTIYRLPHKMGFTVTGTPAGAGMTNVPSIMNLLSRYNRCQSAILEQWVTPQRTISETVRLEEQWAIESVQYLKSLPYFKYSELTDRQTT